MGSAVMGAFVNRVIGAERVVDSLVRSVDGIIVIISSACGFDGDTEGAALDIGASDGEGVCLVVGEDVRGHGGMLHNSGQILAAADHIPLAFMQSDLSSVSQI